MANPIDHFQLFWEEDGGEHCFVLTGELDDGQMTILGTFNQGPFDTRLEVAQWAWRLMAKHLPQ